MASLWNKSVITCLLGAYSRYTSNDIHNPSGYALGIMNIIFGISAQRHVITNTYTDDIIEYIPSEVSDR